MKAEFAFLITSIVLLASEIVYLHTTRVKRVHVMSSRLAAAFAGIGNLGFIFFALFLCNYFQIFYPEILCLLVFGLVGLVYMVMTAKGVHVASDAPEMLQAVIRRKLSEGFNFEEGKKVVVRANRLLGIVSIDTDAFSLSNLTAGLRELGGTPSAKRFAIYLLVCEVLCCLMVCLMLWLAFMLRSFS